MTHNPINAPKRTIYNTKHTKNTNMHFQTSNFFENKKKEIIEINKSNFHFVIYQNPILYIFLHILYNLYI